MPLITLIKQFVKYYRFYTAEVYRGFLQSCKNAEFFKLIVPKTVFKFCC